MNPQFVKRLKSFAWRLGAYVFVGALGWITANLGLLELPPVVHAIAALVLGEITKYLNTEAS